MMIKLSFFIDAYYRELPLNYSVAEKFDNVLQNFTTLELILMLRHTAAGLQAWLPLVKNGKQKT